MARVAPFLFRIASCVLALVPFAAAQAPATAAPETFVLEGRVVSLRGDGVPAAKVWVATSADPDTGLASTIADGEGYFRMKVPKAAPTLQVHTTGERTCRSMAFIRGSATTVRIDVHDAGTVRGVLRDRAGQPRKDVAVRAYPEGRVLFNSHADSRTDAEGRFELSRVPLGPTRIVAWVDGEGLAECEQCIAGDCEVALAPAANPTTSLRIEVAGLPDDAIARVHLLPYDEQGMRRLPPPFEQPSLGAGGVLELKTLPDLQYRVRVGSDGFVVGPRELVAEPAKGPHVLKFTATPSADSVLEWHATVHGPDDKPVGGVPFVMRAAGGGREATATSDADGKMTFRCPLPAGSNIVVYSTDTSWVIDQKKQQEDMHGSSDRRFLAWHECKVATSAELHLRVVPACTVKGRLLKDTGQPAAFAQVQLEERSANRTPEWMAMAWATTDRDGHFVLSRLHHLADAVRVMTNTPDGAVASEPLGITTAGTQVIVPDLRLMAPASIDGVVLDSQQRPAPGIRVWLRDWDLGKHRQRSGSVTEVITDRQGRYRFVGVPPGGAYLELLVEPGEQHASRRAVEPFDVEAGKTYSFDLQVPAK